MVYITDTGLKKLHAHKYSGVDHSYLTRFIFQPYWSWILQYIPLYISANVLTFFGLGAIVINFLTWLFYTSVCTLPCPPWVYFSFSMGLFFYHTMDGIDGKQARRTESSSPIGEFIDHVVDSVVTLLSSLLVSYVLQLHASWTAYFLLIGSLCVFYFCTWETYHTHTLYLGLINAPSEGVVGLFFLYMYAAIFGRPDLSSYAFHLVLFFWGCVTVFCALSSTRVFIVSSSWGDFFLRLKGLFPLVFIVSSTLLWGVTYRVDIIQDYFTLWTLAIGFQLVFFIAHMILGHMTRQPFPLVHVSFFFLLLVCFLCTANLTVPPLIYVFLIYAYFIMNVYSCVHFFTSILCEMKCHLNIDLFKLK